MSWMDKLQVAYLESRDKSDRSPTFVTSVTDFRDPTGELSADISLTPGQSSVARDADRGIPWAEWKAATLNQLFKEQGATGQPGRIMAATIRHCESLHDRVDCGPKHEQPMSPVEPTE
jgi:hypothetical protein